MYLFQPLVQVFILLLLFPLLLQQSVPPAHFWCSTSLKFLFQALDIHYLLFSFIFIYLSELSGRIGQSGIRTRQFCRTERELPFSKLLSKLVGLVRSSSQFPELADLSGQLCLMVSALPAPCPCPVLTLFDR